MNTFKIYFNYIIVLAILCTSCKKSFLDKAPESNLAAGSVTSAEDAENLLTGAYNKMATDGFYQYGNNFPQDSRSDNSYVNGDNVDAEQPFENFTYTAANSQAQGNWQSLYSYIAAANAVTDNVPAVNDPKWAGTNRKNQILGEARFIRALAYYWLVSGWGDCPIILSVTNGGDFYPSRSTAVEVYAQIIRDTKYADSVLPATPYNGQFGRATLGAADALLAKTYAQMGDYTNCLVYCNKVINSGKYSLVSNFSKLWGAANKNTIESIFELQVSSSGTPYSFWGIEIFSYVASDGWPKRNIGSYQLVQAFRAAGDTVGARYKTTLNWQVTTASFNMPANAWDSKKAIPFLGKYPDPGSFSGIDNLVIIRLADIILLAAEANNQLGNTSEAVKQLNQIRNRAGIPNTTAATKAEIALAILNERELELFGEQTRWNDLLRANANNTINLVTYMNNQVNSSGQNLNYNLNADKHQFLLPVPNQDRLLNKNLTQNPGY